MDDPQARDEAIRQLAPFETFSKNVQLSDDLSDVFEDFWDSLRRAKRGDANDFKEELDELIDAFFAPDEPEPAQQVPALTGGAAPGNTGQVSETASQPGTGEAEPAANVSPPASAV
jgi:hypothetical protein